MTFLLISLFSSLFPALAQDVSSSVASQHWDAGVRHSLGDRRDDARREWEACLKAEPAREDCRAGLKLLGVDAAKETAQRYKAGRLYFEAGRRAEARREWQACLRLSPSSEDCRAGLEKIGGDAAKSAETLVQEAEAAYMKGDYTAAAQAAASALAKEPGNRVAMAVQKLSGSKAALPKVPVSRQAPQPKPAQGAIGPLDEESRRQAVKHWNSGIIYFQKGDYQRARDEWLLCQQFDPANQDCVTGLQRIDSSYGAP